MAKTPGPQIRDVQTYLDTMEIVVRQPDFDEAWINERRPSNLLRSSLSRNSNFNFLAEAKSQVQNELSQLGLDESLWDYLLPAVMHSPSHAVSRKAEDEVLVRHALLFCRTATLQIPMELRVCVDVCLRPSQPSPGSTQLTPAEVTRIMVSMDLCDLESEDTSYEALDWLLKSLEEFPTFAAPSRRASDTIIFLGNPLALHCLKTPDDWRIKLESLLSAFGMRATFVQGPDHNGSIPDNVSQVVRFDPYSGEELRRQGDAKLVVTPIAAAEMDFPALLRCVAQALLNATEEVEDNPFELRIIEPGQVIFHRKVGKSRKYDKFDKGSPTPCKHGLESFIPWGGDKAVKGMQRRYSNFIPSWIRHCSQFPNCGMYAVKNPQKNSP